MDPMLETNEVPPGVLALVRAGVGGHLLADVETMADRLQECGFVREVRAGSWSCESAPAWSVQSLDHAPGLSVFTRGDEALVAEVGDRVRAMVDAGEVGQLVRGEPDPDWTCWSSDGLLVSLHASTGRWFAQRWHPADLQLALERADTPPEGLPVDLERYRRVAREGSAVARWHLAGQDDLPDDVVDRLTHDGDPAVVAALQANEPQRRAARLR